MINALDRGTGLARDEYDDYVVQTVTEEHMREPISMFLSSVRSDQMSTEAVHRIKEPGILTVNVTLADKIGYYLNPQRDSERRRIRENGRNRAANDHMWTQRFDQIFRVLGIQS
jgi:hypothetical protein